MIGIRALAILIILAVGTTAAAPTVDKLKVETVGDPDLLPIVFEKLDGREDDSQRLPVGNHFRVYQPAGPHSDSAVTVCAFNTVLGRDDPAVFSYFNQTSRRVIDDDPVRATVTGYEFYFDRNAEKKSLLAGGYRNDSALAIKMIPMTDRPEYLFLISGIDHTGNGTWEPRVSVLLAEDYDYDGDQEVFVYVSPGRDLEPRALFCIDPQKLLIEWSLPVSSVVTGGSFHSCRDSVNPGVIFTTANVKNGVADELFDDRFSYVARVNSHGEPVFRYIISEEHSGGGLWPAETPGMFFLYHPMSLVSPEDTAALPDHVRRLSKIDAQGNILQSTEVQTPLADAWIADYADQPGPCLYTLSTTGEISAYDNSLTLLARSEETVLRRMLETFRVEGVGDSVRLFATTTGLDLYTHDFGLLGRFPGVFNRFHPLVLGDDGEVVRFIVSGSNSHFIVGIERRDLIDYASILFWKYQHSILIVLVLLALALVVVNAFRHRAVRKLKESVRRFKDMADLLPQGVFEIAADGLVTFANREALRMYGLTQEDVAGGMYAPEVIIPEDRERIMANLQKVVAGEATSEIEYTALRKDGSTFPILTYSSSVSKDGRVVGIRGVVIDITEKRRTDKALRESEYKWRSLVENTPDYIFAVDRNLRILSMERAMQGLTPENIVGTPIHEYVAPEHQKPLKEAVARVFESGKTEMIEVLSLGPEGPQTAWYESRLVPMARDGQIERVQFINTDITERRKAQEALQKSEANYRSLVESAGEAIFNLDHDGIYLFVNSVAARRLGRSPEEIVGKSMTDMFPSQHAERQLRSIRSIFETGEGKTFETVTQIRGKDRWYRTSLQPVRDVQGRIISVMGIGRDITEAVEIQRALGSERDFVRSMLDTSNSLVFCLDKYARITVFNKECERVTGYKRDEVMGKVWPDLFVPKENHRHTSENFAEWVREHPSDSYEAPIITRSGELRTILWSNSAMFHPGTDDLTAIAVGQDITDRKRAEEELQESERKYRSLVEYSLQAIFIVQGEEIVLANRRLSEMLEVSQEYLDGLKLGNILQFVSDPEVQKRLRGSHLALLAGELVDASLELQVETGTGGKIWAEAMAHRITYEGEPAVIVVLIDITERKAAAARMEAINREKYEQAQRIAGGFAHEIRNSLFPAEAALYRLVGGGAGTGKRTDGDVQKFSRAAAAAVSRAIDVTELISYYTSLDSVHHPEPVDLASLIKEVMGANTFAIEDLDVEITLSGLDGLLVESNRQQLYLVFNNLLLNSLDALTEQGRPAIFVEAAERHESVRIVFGDNGCGIPPSEIKEVFDTFFSSKPNKGTGLGLAMSRQIIEMYGGTIDVESRVEEWTRFEITMLRATEGAET